MGRADRNEAGGRGEAGISPEVETQAAELVGTRGKDEDRPGRRFGASRVLSAADRDRILQDARSVEFSAALRGYDRDQVDRYVEKMSRLITELEMSSSPEAAVRHALDEVSDETRDILQRAHQTADEITARSRSKADDRLQQAEREAQEALEAAQRQAQDMRETAQRQAREVRDTAQHEAEDLRTTAASEVQNQKETAHRETDDLRSRTMQEIAELRDTAAREAHQVRSAAQRESDEMRGNARREAEEMLESAEARARDLARNAEAIWGERRRLIDDMRGVGEQLVAIGEVEGKRFPRPVDDSFLGHEHPGGNGAPGTDEPAAAPEPVSSDTQA